MKYVIIKISFLPDFCGYNYLHMFFLILFLIILTIYCVFAVTQFYHIIFKGWAPFVSTDIKTINKIIKEIGSFAGSNIYELGCGWALFLKQAEKSFPSAKLTGIENSFVLFWLDRIWTILFKSKIILFKQNFFAADLSTADLIYCYLNNETMAKLGKKFQAECLPGTIIISRRFPVLIFKPEKIIKINRQKIYFYKI